MNDTMDRDDVGRKVVQTSQACAAGYKRGITNFSTEAEREANEKCSIAASNTGWFILQALGFSNEEKKSLIDKWASCENLESNGTRVTNE